MITHVILSSNFIRQLKHLRQTGGMAKAVAEHAEAIIQQWVSGEMVSPRQLTRSTRSGERRIKDCWKYDLIEACRLLTVMAEDHLIFLFVGTHDECDQWLRHNKGWEPEGAKKGDKVLPVQRTTPQTAAEEAAFEEDEAPEDYLSGEIDERDLRIIFAGICRSRAEQPQAAPKMGCSD